MKAPLHIQSLTFKIKKSDFWSGEFCHCPMDDWMGFYHDRNKIMGSDDGVMENDLLFFLLQLLSRVIVMSSTPL